MDIVFFTSDNSPEFGDCLISYLNEKAMVLLSTYPDHMHDDVDLHKSIMDSVTNDFTGDFNG